MRMSTERVKALCRERGLSTTALLAEAGVSRNAFYTLARRRSVFPHSMEAVSAALGVRPDQLLTSDDRRTEGMKALLAQVDAIVKANRGVDRDNVRHTLLALRRKPIDRLRTALTRAR